MLLSRVADALYWISRYLERAEHTARLVNVAVDLNLDGATAVDAEALERLYACFGLRPAELSSSSPVEAALFDVVGRNSVTACVTAARENARQVREEISADMWEQINAVYLQLRQNRDDPMRAARAHYVSRAVIQGVHLFQGITDATMGHGEGWRYLQAGRCLERATATAALLGAFPGDGDRQPADGVVLLRACSALEAYCRHYTADVRPERVTEFLLLNAEFPRSVRFAATRLEDALKALGRHASRGTGMRTERLAGRLRASLDFAQVDEILADGPAAYLAGVGRQCAQIHAAIYQGYIAYPIETALPA